ncbi:flagellar biosynthetic protein FliR [Pantoea septica]|uniref:flagellar biosynthetic protein FliR n=1 Tax=Pantoea septica TaxID=472695 RepID=UPI0023F48CA3|nr:flagellar biosynthetic protein FliR [Pantoea septica]
MNIAWADLQALLNHYFWPWLRLLALFSAAPVFSEKQPGKKVKIALAVLITLLVAPSLPAVAIPVFSAAGVWTGAKQLIIGVSIGLTIQMAFVTVRTAGEIIGLQMGLSFATFFDPAGGQNMPVLSRLLNLFVTLLFLSFNGHLWLIAIVVQSFERLPIDDAPLVRDGFYALVEHAGIIFSYGLMLGLPVVTLLLAINLALGLLNRLTPQLSIFVIGFPLTLTVGMLSLSMLMRTLTPFLENLLRLLFDGLDEMLMMFI